MIDKEKKTITIKADSGEEREFDILFIFNKKGTDREYVVFTDYSPNETGGTSLSAASYDPADPQMHLDPISDEEWEDIYHILEEMQNELNSEE